MAAFGKELLLLSDTSFNYALLVLIGAVFLSSFLVNSTSIVLNNYSKMSSILQRELKQSPKPPMRISEHNSTLELVEHDKTATAPELDYDATAFELDGSSLASEVYDYKVDDDEDNDNGSEDI